MKLIVITTPSFFIEEDQIITTLFEEGLDVLHLRKPDSSLTYLDRLINLIPEKYHKKIVTHDQFVLKSEYDLRGIHLSARNPEVPYDYHGHVSCSCHSLEEVQECKKSSSYVFMSPVFDSISKEGYKSAFSEDELLAARKAKIIDDKVIALGGITADKIEKVKDYGFGGVAVLGDLWNRFNPKTDRDYTALIEHFKELKNLVD